MPCPYFEPQRPVAQRSFVHARLPLIDEYEGRCRANGSCEPVPEDVRFQCCNHGNSRSTCPRFPAVETRSALRYHLVSRSATEIELVCVEENNYAPAAWYVVRYAVAGGTISPDISNDCLRAQILAFCRSYLDRFPVI